MFGKRNARIVSGASVSPIRNSDEMFCVEMVRLVPTVYRVVLPAADSLAARRLAAEVVRAAPETGGPEYVGASELAVRELRLMPAGERSRAVPVPSEFQIGPMKR